MSKSVLISISIIILLLFCSFLLGTATVEEPQVDLAEYQEMTVETEEILQSATANVVKKRYFPFGWKQNADGEYTFLCKAKHFNPEKFYFALVTIDTSEGSYPVFKNAVQIAECYEEKYIKAYEAARPVKTLDEYTYLEILGSEELLTEYRETHPYLDDLHLWDIEEDKLLCQIGYSYVWNVLSVVFRVDDHEELYSDVPSPIFNSFMENPDKSSYFKLVIQRNYNLLQLPEKPD